MRTPIPRTPGSRVRALRHLKGLTLAQLAKKARLVESTVFRLEVGDRKPNPIHLKALADALGCSVKYLYIPSRDDR